MILAILFIVIYLAIGLFICDASINSSERIRIELSGSPEYIYMLLYMVIAIVWLPLMVYSILKTVSDWVLR